MNAHPTSTEMGRGRGIAPFPGTPSPKNNLGRLHKSLDTPDVLKLFFKRPPSFCIHWRFSLKPHCEAAADNGQLRLSFFHCSAPILCRSSLCVPRYRTIRSPAVLPV